MRLLKEVLADIKPTKEEDKEVEERTREFISKLNKALKDGKAVLGGSGAKGTWLARQHDADVFVQFNYKKYKDKSDKLSDVLEKVLKKTFGKIKRLHGSRDYFQIKQKAFTFEVIPILKINKAEDALNITDVSPLHADWVKKAKPLADEIRLTKQFLKAHGLYGAESYIKGFSGYMAEVLTIHYGGFLKLVRAAAKWDREGKTIIDTQQYYRNKNAVFFNLNKSKQQSPLILIDPVQKNRNAAAALSEEKYLKFIIACEMFLSIPIKEDFHTIELTLDEIKKLKPLKPNHQKIILKIKLLSGKEDVVGCKMVKVIDYIIAGMEKEGFRIYGKSWQWDKKKDALFWFYTDKAKLPEYKEIKGPPVKMEKYAKDFKKKHKKTIVKAGKLIAKDKRKYRDANKLVNKLIKDKYVKERVKGISKI